MSKIVALALLLLTALFAAPIHAQTNSPSDKPQAHSLQFNGARMNGVSLNGRTLNGRSLNGRTMNGRAFNGIHLNGKAFNGVVLNGFHVNGYRWNGFHVNGYRWNGSAFAQSEQSPMSGILLEQVKVLTSSQAPTASQH